MADLYLVVTRDKQRLPISRPLHSVKDAGDYIYQRKGFALYMVVAQPMNGRMRASGPQRDLTLSEKKELEQRLYPALFDNGL
jgi:hypothetical protein